MTDIRVSFVLQGLPDSKMAQAKAVGALHDPLTKLLGEFMKAHEGITVGDITTGEVRGQKEKAEQPRRNLLSIPG